MRNRGELPPWSYRGLASALLFLHDVLVLGLDLIDDAVQVQGSDCCPWTGPQTCHEGDSAFRSVPVGNMEPYFHHLLASRDAENKEESLPPQQGPRGRAEISACISGPATAQQGIPDNKQKGKRNNTCIRPGLCLQVSVSEPSGWVFPEDCSKEGPLEELS